MVLDTKNKILIKIILSISSKMRGSYYDLHRLPFVTIMSDTVFFFTKGQKLEVERFKIRQFGS